MYYTELMISRPIICHEKTTLHNTSHLWYLRFWLGIWGKFIVHSQGNVTRRTLALKRIHQDWIKQDNKLLQGKTDFVYFSATCYRKYYYCGELFTLFTVNFFLAVCKMNNALSGLFMSMEILK